MDPKLEFEIKTPQGQTELVDDQFVMQSLAGAGFNPVSLSPDGTTVTLQDAQGPYEVGVEDVLKEFGNTVVGMKPVAFDSENIQESWRAVISQIPDDADKRAFIEAKMRRLGVDTPQVLGSGRDWFVFNPQSAQYVAVTNTPDWEMGDLAEAGMTVPRMLASGVGAAVAGPLGAAGLGAGTDVLTRLGTAAVDEDFREVAGRNLGSQASDVGIGAGLDILTGGLAKGLGALRGTRGALQTGPVSTAMRGVGAVTEGAGAVTSGVGKALNTGPGRFVGEMTLPGIDMVSGAGYLAQAPEMLVKGGARGLGHLGQNATVRQAAPNASATMRNWARGLLEPRGMPNLAEEMASKLRQGAAPRQTASARDIVGNLFEKGGMRAREAVGLSGREAERKTMTKAFRDVVARGGTEEEAVSAALKARRAAVRGDLDAASRLGRAGETVGTVVKGMGDVGRGLETIGRTGVQGTSAVLRGTGAAARKAGAATRNVGTVLQPVENTAWMRGAAEEFLTPELQRRQMERLRRSGGRGAGGSMSEEVLASRY